MATHIEWTDETWNPTTGCTKVSQGCKFCYAEVMHERLTAIGLDKYAQPFTTVVCHPDELQKPKEWKRPKMIFVNSMSDLFHDDIPDVFIKDVFAVMNDSQCAHHKFQILTKRSARLAELAPQLIWGSNIWMGVSVESPNVWHRVSDLLTVPAAVRFLSMEPLLQAFVAPDFTGLQWVIAGGESGKNARSINVDWVRVIRDVCFAQRVPFFFKQWGGKNKKASGCELDGVVVQQLPGHYDNTLQPQTLF